MRLAPEFDADLLSRVEDAGLNASAPPQQRWVDGWLLRYSPGKAKRARCINAVAAGRLPVEAKLAQCAAVFREAGLPMVVRITPFTLPAGLEERLVELGMRRIDDTRVMVRATLDGLTAPVLPTGWRIEATPGRAYSAIVGGWRGSTEVQCEAHAQRLALSPVPYQAFLLRTPDGEPAGGGQMAREGELVGLYDVFIAPGHRGRGLARALCSHLLALAHGQGAQAGYLQVEGDNLAARAVYHRLGFADGYGYHYRTDEASAA